MEKKQSINGIMVSVIILATGFGLMAGCGDKKSESENSSMPEQNMMNEAPTFTAMLGGDNEVPPVTSNATGMVTVTLNGDSVEVSGQFSGLSGTYSASHIHMAAEGENGGAIQPLDPDINSDSISGAFNGSYTLTAPHISALKAGNFYINVHSSEHPSGEIRGQLTASGSEM